MRIITKHEIDEFFNCKNIVVAGASRNDKSFSASVIKHLRSLGYNVFSINPNFSANNPEKNEFQSIENLPQVQANLVVLTSAKYTTSVVEQALKKGFTNIWIQQKSETQQAVELCNKANVKLIYNHCVFMFTKPTGVHHFHYSVKKIFRSLPR